MITKNVVWVDDTGMVRTLLAYNNDIRSAVTAELKFIEMVRESGNNILSDNEILNLEFVELLDGGSIQLISSESK